jgi:hypothetical protein
VGDLDGAMTLAMRLGLALFMAAGGASAAERGMADDPSLPGLGMHPSSLVVPEASVDSPESAIEEYQSSAASPPTVPEVTTVLFLAFGASMIVARHRHPRRQRSR